MKIRALPGRLLVNEIKKGRRKVGRFILPNDDGTTGGIRPRWCRVASTGKGVRDINEGDWVLVKHGDWTRSITVTHGGEEMELWGIKYPDGVLAITDDPDAAESWHGTEVIQTEKLDRA